MPVVSAVVAAPATAVDSAASVTVVVFIAALVSWQPSSSEL